ncbi:branched-chain amino acid ABC transporter substrate-binding protein [Candidatus Magnetobacterium bavaricum]|uniref:Branched-chain amino acid ABC transporter substrate-binding protein n=1 Tax=Candidatus Magnetobacterium bavaricum TaxID=29290 RepID=A0A0F3GNL1_9BACT|nr:branched-chain amino acid ABC transporter substrate-binding protein [Candidatus Magnetobacterium bavaricum]
MLITRVLVLFVVFLNLLSLELFAQEVIRIPVVSPYTGSLASFGEGVKNAALLKAGEINARGGINGKKVEIRLEDDLCEPKEASNVSARLANDKDVVIVVGHLCSSATLAALPIYKKAELVAITPASTNPTIGKSGGGYYFRNVYQDEFQGAFLARYADEAMKWKKIVVFYETNDYSMGLKTAFVEEAKKRGLKLLGQEAYTSATTDFTPQLAKFRMLQPDAVFIPGYAPQGTLIINQAVKLGMKVHFFGADGLDDAIMLSNKNADGLLVTTPFLADAAGGQAKAFIDAYTKKFGKQPNWFAANTYDAVGIAAEAIAQAGPNRRKIRQHLAAINSPQNAYKGVSGDTYFDKNGDCLKPAFIKVIKDGQWVSAQEQLK